MIEPYILTVLLPSVNISRIGKNDQRSLGLVLENLGKRNVKFSTTPGDFSDDDKPSISTLLPPSSSVNIDKLNDTVNRLVYS